jgi:hypothetical protein
MGFRQSCFERDPLRFGFNELKMVRGSNGPEGNTMVIGPRRESRFLRLEPIKNEKGQEKKKI